MNSTFNSYWRVYSEKTLADKQDYFSSLSINSQKKLLKSFFAEKLYSLYLQNIIDQTLDNIKEQYDIDLIDLRIKAIKFGRTFLIEKEIWDNIENSLYSDAYDTDIYFGGLLVQSWNEQFYRIRAHKNLWRY